MNEASFVSLEAQRAKPVAQVVLPEETLRRLLDLLQLAARRGAFEIDEYQKIGEVYTQGVLAASKQSN